MYEAKMAVSMLCDLSDAGRLRGENRAGQRTGFTHAAEHIRRGLSVKEVTEMYHFSEYSAFCRLFKKYFRITPTEYRQLAEKDQLEIVPAEKCKR